ncbi:MAG: hypothetical protein AB8G86_04835 [Saprospiraceae bacterium]
MAHVSSNQPYSKYQAEKYPPNTFPIHLHLIFSKSNSHIAEEVKKLTSELPKDNFRYQKKVNKYAGISINIYFKDADTMRPVLQGLKNKDLYADRAIGKDEVVYPYQLLSKAKEILKGQGRGL